MKAFMCLLVDKEEARQHHRVKRKDRRNYSALAPPGGGRWTSHSLQTFDNSGEEVGHSAADLRAAVPQASLVQKGHLTANATAISYRKCVRSAGNAQGKTQTYQHGGDVLRLHNEELVIADDGLKELQRHRRVLVAADVTGNQLRGQK